MKDLTVAIDGPAGAGKTTVSRRVAEVLGYRYVDTGAMYRAVAWRMRRAGIDLADEAAVVALAERLRFEFRTADGGQARLFVDGEDVSAAVREPEVTRLSSPVSAIPGVRRALVARQREMGAAGGVVMEGRDIGTVVFPDAEVKVFLTATDTERARRRTEELRARGEAAEPGQVLAAIRERDARDSTRADSPLRPADDSVTLVSDGLTVDEVVARIVALCRERAARRRETHET